MTNAGLMNLLGARYPDGAFATVPELENTYRHLFLRDLAALGEIDDYYPVGGAANYGLLYLIQRIAQTFKPRCVLDVGCGETTRLWSRLRARGLVRRVLTLESDPDWAARIGREVGHRIAVSPLRSAIVAGSVIETYDWATALAEGPFDVIGVDGPLGQPRRSRAGVLSLLDESLPKDFIVFMDDAERPGEQETLCLIHDRLRALNRDYVSGPIRAAKTQAIFAGGAYRSAVYF